MPGTKEIRVKIRSVQNTRKITKAMEMVAASKMRKAQERMRMARPYGEKIRTVAAHISHANPEYRHPFLVLRDSVRRVGLIVITTDKGLCGALNTNLLRMVLDARQRFEGELEAVCGKVGGYARYSSAFGPLAGRLHAIVEEGAKRSTYSFPGLGTIAFVRDADQSHLLVAMASMVGKWIREVLMSRIVRHYGKGDDAYAHGERVPIRMRVERVIRHK